MTHRQRTQLYVGLGAVVLLGGCGVVGVVGDGIVGDAPAIDQNDGDTGGAALNPLVTTGQPDPGHPSGDEGSASAAPSPASASIAREGEGCWKRTCLQGLACVAIYDGPKVIGKHCLERCATLGKDPNCDGGETCTKSLDEGKVCFNPANPAGGFTSNGPGSKDKGGGGPNPGPQGACGSQQESQVFQLLNQARAQNGMGAVACDLKASAVARAHSQDMCNRGYFSHTSLDGRSHSARLKAGGVPFSSSGENIAWGYSGPQQVHQGWMTSPGHRQNMLTPSWTRVGIGQVNCGGKPHWTEVFMR